MAAEAPGREGAGAAGPGSSLRGEEVETSTSEPIFEQFRAVSKAFKGIQRLFPAWKRAKTHLEPDPKRSRTRHDGSPRHRDGGPPHIEVDPGESLGDYVVEEVYGDGVSGRVLGCRDLSGALVAVKVCRPARRQRRHAETEVATLQRLQRNGEHAEHVVRLLDTFEHCVGAAWQSLEQLQGT